MRGFNRGIVNVSLVLLALAFMNKGYHLWSIKELVADSSIDVSFLGFEIGNNVSGESIPTYSIIFWCLGIITFLVFMLQIIYSYVKTKRNQNKV